MIRIFGGQCLRKIQGDMFGGMSSFRRSRSIDGELDIEQDNGLLLDLRMN